MPNFEDRPAALYTKILYIGDSSTGKTGSLVSLLADGYKFKILDFDNGLDSLDYYAKELCPDMRKNIEYEMRRDVYVASNAALVCRKPAAFVEGLKILTDWSAIEDPQTIFVLDSLSAFGKAAFEWAKGMNPMAKDPRQWYFSAQQAIENVITLITSEAFRMNAIVITHVNYKEITEGVHKGYANAIGSALGPTLPKYFNTLICAESQGSGKNVKRKIKTVPTGIIDLKIASPKIDGELPLETGMSTIFKILKGKSV